MKIKNKYEWEKFVKTMDDAIEKLNKLLPPKTVSAKTLMLQFYCNN